MAVARPWPTCHGAERPCWVRAGCIGLGRGLAVMCAEGGHQPAEARGSEVDCFRNHLYATVVTGFACVDGCRESDCFPSSVAHLSVDHRVGRPTGVSWSAHHLPCGHPDVPCPRGHGPVLASGLLVHVLVYCRAVCGHFLHHQLGECARPCDCLVHCPQPGGRAVTPQVWVPVYLQSYSKRGTEGIPSS